MAFESLINSLTDLKNGKNMMEAIEIVEEDARFRTPIDTGFLQNSTVKNQLSNTKFELVYVCEYGIYVHEILRYYHPYGEAKFLENAWNNKKDEFFKKLIDVF